VPIVVANKKAAKNKELNGEERGYKRYVQGAIQEQQAPKVSPSRGWLKRDCVIIAWCGNQVQCAVPGSASDVAVVVGVVFADAVGYSGPEMAIRFLLILSHSDRCRCFHRESGGEDDDDDDDYFRYCCHSTSSLHSLDGGCSRPSSRNLVHWAEYQ